MALNIKSPVADDLARRLAAATGESLTEAVSKALAERLAQVERRGSSARRLALQEIRERVTSMPVLDERSDDDLLGYDHGGTFN